MEDMSPLTNSVMELMETLEPLDATVKTVAICVELEDPEGTSWTRIYCNDGRSWYQAAFLEQALDALVYDQESDS
jgi:hypothetical protein